MTGVLELQLLGLLETDDREEDAELNGGTEVCPAIVDVSNDFVRKFRGDGLVAVPGRGQVLVEPVLDSLSLESLHGLIVVEVVVEVVAWLIGGKGVLVRTVIGEERRQTRRRGKKTKEPPDSGLFMRKRKKRRKGAT